MAFDPRIWEIFPLAHIFFSGLPQSFGFSSRIFAHPLLCFLLCVFVAVNGLLADCCLWWETKKGQIMI
jgi:hypothetical protein